MASREKLKEEFLTCIVCHEVFRDPVTLHCGHTFCTQCVTAYTRTQQKAIAEKSIPCPSCRGLTKIPDPLEPVESWAGQIKTGFFVKGLVDAVLAENKADEREYLCVSCQEGGDSVLAVVWCCDCEHGLCSGCERYHKRLPMSKGHEVLPLSDVEKPKLRQSRKPYFCHKHPDAVIDMMCEDCDVAVCHRCCILHHRKCESVITLEEYLPKMKAVIENHSKELENTVKKVKEELFMTKLQIKEVEKEAAEAVTVIDESGEKIIAVVREQQQQLKEKVKQAKDGAVQTLKGDIKSGEMTLEEAQQRQGLIRKAIKSDIIMNYYDMYKICKPKALRKLDNAAKLSDRKDPNRIKIRDKSDELVSIMTSTPFASYDDKPLQMGSLSKPTLVKKIDTGLSDIWDVLVMTVGGIETVIVTSRDGHSVTSFYQRGGKECKSELKLEGNAFNVTKTSEGKCAVAVYSAKQIEFLFVTPCLKREKKIATMKGYFGLTCLNSTTLAAGTEYPGGVDIIDTSGSVLRSFGSNDYTGSVYLSCTSDGTILVSDWITKSVTGSDDRGIIKFKSARNSENKLVCPRGISHSKSGDIFVANGNSENVIQLTDTGKFVRVALSAADGIVTPRALYIDDNNLMYVSVNHTTIHVFRLKDL